MAECILMKSASGAVLRGYIAYLGHSTSTIDVKALFPTDYQSFRAEDFLLQPRNISTSATATGASVEAWRGFNCTSSWQHNITKTYNATNGILTIGLHNYHRNGSEGYGGAWATNQNDADIDVYLYHESIPVSADSSAILIRGTGSSNSGECSILANFEDFTIDNFVISIENGNSGSRDYYRGGSGEGEKRNSWTANPFFEITKAYNQETGVFSFSISATENSAFTYKVYLKI